MKPAEFVRPLVALALVSGIPRAVADSPWTPVAQTEEGIYLLDEASIDFRSGLLTAWEMVDYALPQYADGVGYRSQMNLRAYRCADRTWDVLQVTRFEGPQRTGEAVLSSSFPTSEVVWYRARPESVAARMLDRVCALAGA